MKNNKAILAATILLFSNCLISQVKSSSYFGYLELGAQKALSSKSHTVNGFRASYNSVLKDKYFFGVNVLGSFEKNFADRRYPNHLNNHMGYYANFGYRNHVSKNFYITPSIGIGTSKYTITDFSIDKENNATNTKYTSIVQNQIIVPINLNILYTGRYAGIGFNFYFVGGKYTEAGAGLSFAFGKIRDKHAPIILDKDGDGITDLEDNCPDDKGLVEFKGCPDKDGDKITDKDDKCPNDAGLAEFLGCPDKDGDKVIDMEDNCPEVIGAIENKGCPWEDKDKDGIFDKDDECPEIAGIKELKGCPAAPVLKIEEQKIVAEAISSLEFATGKDIVTKESLPGLDQLAELMKLHAADWQLKLSGHTDNQGGLEENLVLSEKRVQKVKQYLISKGVNENQVITEWFGQTIAIADNATEEGRKKNRRVEMKVEYKK